ncbi:MAG: tetratricopeptide repeat protein [Desulfobulbaceae bacterium]|nr:tetratricopeptide repeat protein [Desulfobulbaceae bacterium]
MAKKRVKSESDRKRVVAANLQAHSCSIGESESRRGVSSASRMGPGALELWLCVLAIFLCGLLAFSNNLDGEFIFDDYPAIIDNPDIKSLLPPWPLLLPTPNSSPLAARPVPSVSVAINYAIGGLDVRGYHVFNNAIHVLAAFALFALVRSTLLLPRFSTHFGLAANRYALLVAVLWMVHPLQTEAVNYISQRTETLMGLFYLATLSFAAGAFRSSRPQFCYVMAVVSCVLGMASKEVMVSAPLLVLLYDRLFVLGTFRKALLTRRWFYGCLAASWAVLIFYQLNNPRASSVLFDSVELSVLDYFRTQLSIVVHYLRQAFWPYPLILDSHDWPVTRNFSGGFFLSATLLAVMIGATIWGVQRSAWWSFLGAWFFCILAPTSSFIPIVTEIVAERRMYLPLAAVVVSVVFTVDYVWRKGHGGTHAKVVLSVLVIFTMAVMTWSRNQDYRTELSIWADTVAKRPGNARAQENLGKALMKEGHFAEAVQPIMEALRLTPDRQQDPELYTNLGRIFSQLGRFQKAIDAYQQVVVMSPNDALAQYNLGNAFIRVNDLEKAEFSFQKAITLDPAFIPAKGNLGMILMKKGDYAGAEAQFQSIRTLAPGVASSHAMLADLRVEQGRFAEAIPLYREAVRIDPGAQNISERLAAILAAHPEAADNLLQNRQ